MYIFFKWNSALLLLIIAINLWYWDFEIKLNIRKLQVSFVVCVNEHLWRAYVTLHLHIRYEVLKDYGEASSCHVYLRQWYLISRKDEILRVELILHRMCIYIRKIYIKALIVWITLIRNNFIRNLMNLLYYITIFILITCILVAIDSYSAQ